MSQIPLTLISSQGGCAAKIPREILHSIISKLQISDEHARSIITNNEDAGSIKTEYGTIITQSIDAITPVSDDPFVFGGVAIAHSLSDLYAKGARPLTGLLLLGLPAVVSAETAREILQGAIDKLYKAGASFLGGHTISTKELFVGLAVTGINDQMPVSNIGCKEGDVLILTKPLGSGIIITSIKLKNAQVAFDNFSSDAVINCERIMLDFNSKPSEVMMRIGVNACTDVTGFGLIGHLSQMLYGTKLTAQISIKAIPVMTGVMDLAHQDIFSTGGEQNAAYWWKDCEYLGNSIKYPQKMILFDPQTSGGLLMSVAPEKAQMLLNNLQSSGIENAAIIGEIVRRKNVPIVITP